MSVVLRVMPPDKVEEPFLFGNSFVRPHRGRAGLAGSLVIHAVLLVALAAVNDSQGPGWHSTMRSAYEVHPLRLRLPEKLFLPGPAQSARTGSSVPKQHVPRGVRPLISPDLELPDLAVRADVRSTVLQLYAAAGVKLQSPLPNLTFWSVALAPRPLDKRFLLPQGKQASGLPALPDPPALRTSMPVVHVEVQASQAALGWPSSQSGPLRLRRTPPAPGDFPELNLTSGPDAPAHLISISAEVVPGSEFVTIPPVVQKMPSGERPQQTINGTAASDSVPPAAGASAGPAIGSELAAKIDRPANGRFGYVVVGSASEAYPQTAGILTGRLVYTVYVRVDAGRDWTMQYCLSNEADGTARGQVDPPFPLTIYRPRLKRPPDLDPVLVGGRVNASGRLEALSIVPGSVLAESDLLLRCLREWIFRPASANGEPVAVEVLLIIPREGL